MPKAMLFFLLITAAAVALAAWRFFGLVLDQHQIESLTIFTG